MFFPRHLLLHLAGGEPVLEFKVFVEWLGGEIRLYNYQPGKHIRSGLSSIAPSLVRRYVQTIATLEPKQKLLAEEHNVQILHHVLIILPCRMPSVLHLLSA
jgi:hypothetical protein